MNEFSKEHSGLAHFNVTLTAFAGALCSTISLSVSLICDV